MLKRGMYVLLTMLTIVVVALSVQQADQDEIETIRLASAVGEEFTVPTDERLADDATTTAIIDSAKAGHVNIVRQAYGYDSAGHETSTFFVYLSHPTAFFQSIRLISGRLPAPSDTDSGRILLASSQAPQAPTIGRLQDIGHNDRIVIAGLQAQSDTLSVSGSYRLEGSNHAKARFRTELANQLNRFVGDTTFNDASFSPDSSVSSVVIPARSYLGVIEIILVATAIMLIIYRQLAEAKTAGIMSLQGIGLGGAWLRITARPTVASIGVAGSIALLACFLIPGGTSAIFVSSAQNLAIVTLGILALSGLAMVATSRARVVDAIKNRKETRVLFGFATVLKALLASAVIVAISGVATEVTFQQREQQLIDSWSKTSDYGVFSPRSVGSDQAALASGDTAGQAAEAFGLYPALNRAGALFVDAREFTDYQTDGVSAMNESRAPFPSITVNPNYLKEFPIPDPSGKQISVTEAETDWIVLVPESQRPESDSIKKYFQTLRTGDGTVEGIVGNSQRSLGRPIPDAVRNQHVQLRYYANGQRIFTFSPDVNHYGGNTVSDPIIQVMTINNSIGIDRTGLTGDGNAFLKVKLTKDAATTLKQLKPLLQKWKLDDNLTSIVTMTGYARDQLAFSRDGMRDTTFVAIGMVLAMAALAFQAIILMFDQFSRKIIVRRLFGYRFIRQYGEFLTVFIVAAATQLVGALLFASGNTSFSQTPPPWPTVLIVGSLIIATELACCVLFLRWLERRRTPTALKGEF